MNILFHQPISLRSDDAFTLSGHRTEPSCLRHCSWSQPTSLRIPFAAFSVLYLINCRECIRFTSNIFIALFPVYCDPSHVFRCFAFQPSSLSFTKRTWEQVPSLDKISHEYQVLFCLLVFAALYHTPSDTYLVFYFYRHVHNLYRIK